MVHSAIGKSLNSKVLYSPISPPLRSENLVLLKCSIRKYYILLYPHPCEQKALYNIANFGGEVLMNRRGELGGVRIERQQYRRWGANKNNETEVLSNTIKAGRARERGR